MKLKLVVFDDWKIKYFHFLLKVMWIMILTNLSRSVSLLFVDGGLCRGRLPGREWNGHDGLCG